MRNTIANFAIVLLALPVLISASMAAEPSDYLGRAGQNRKILNADMPPGALGAARLAGRGPVAGYYQPVAISGPEDTEFALAYSGAFLDGTPRLTAGLLVGGVYRFRITKIPGAPGAELYPTIEVIDRTYPPPGLATSYPIQLVLDEEDFRAALNGQLVTRVIYLEDPQTATPEVQTQETTRPMDVTQFDDPMDVADRFGKPVAVVRIGSVAPPRSMELMPGFFFGYPTWTPIYQPEPVADQWVPHPIFNETDSSSTVSDLDDANQKEAVE
jgi:hypothetical protein